MKSSLVKKISILAMTILLIVMPLLLASCDESIGDGNINSKEVTLTYGEIGVEKHNYFPYATVSVNGNTIKSVKMGEAFGPTGKLWINDGTAGAIAYNNPWYPNINGTIKNKGYTNATIESLDVSQRHFINIDGQVFVLSAKPDHNVMQVRAKDVLMFRSYKPGDVSTSVIIDSVGTGIVDDHRNIGNYPSDAVINYVLSFLKGKTPQEILEYIDNGGDLLDGNTGATNTMNGLIHSIRAVFDIDSRLNYQNLTNWDDVNNGDWATISGNEKLTVQNVIDKLNAIHSANSWEYADAQMLVDSGAITDTTSVVALYKADDGTIVLEGGGDSGISYGGISLMTVFSTEVELDPNTQWLSDKYIADNMEWYIDSINSDKVFACDSTGARRSGTATIDGVDMDFSKSPADGALLKDDENSTYQPSRGLNGANFRPAMQLIAQKIIDGNGTVEFVKVESGGNWDGLRIKDIDYYSIFDVDASTGATADNKEEFNQKWLQYGATYAQVAIKALQIAKGMSLE